MFFIAKYPNIQNILNIQAWCGDDVEDFPKEDPDD